MPGAEDGYIGALLGPERTRESVVFSGKNMQAFIVALSARFGCLRVACGGSVCVV